MDLSWARLSGLENRYFNNSLLEKCFSILPSSIQIKIIGSSEENRPIYRMQIGSGKKKILAWSQMHGNETTNTRAILDLYNFLAQYENHLSDSFIKKQIHNFLKDHTIYCVPILNPDGAEVYTRVNANGMDLNRDAKERTQKESQLLWQQALELQPELCLNLHDQRSIFGLETQKPATISFLAPSANEERDVTLARKIAIKAIERANYILQQKIPNQVGRFDDSFNINCSGDYFTNMEYPTILIEAGHYNKDYARETTRNLLLLSYLAIFDIIYDFELVYLKPYLTIPENQKNFADLLLLDVIVDKTKEKVNIALYFKEVLVDRQVKFIPEFSHIVPENKEQLAHQIVEWVSHEAIIGEDDVLTWGIDFLTNLNSSGKMLLKAIKIQL